MEESECVGSGLSSPEKLVKEHFIVDELLDFPNEEDDKVLFTVGDENVYDVEPVNSSESSTVATAEAGAQNSKLASDDACPNFLCGDLCEPYEELAELEWLSNFVEESFSSEDLEKLHLISGTKVQTEAQTNRNTNHSTPEQGLFLPEAPVPGKARSKRSRAAVSSAWSSSLLVLSPSTSTSCDSELLVPNNGNATKKTRKEEKRAAGKAELGGVGWEEVLALRDGQDAAMADGAVGTEDSVQCVWSEVQVREAGAGVPAGGEPYVRAF